MIKGLLMLASAAGAVMGPSRACAWTLEVGAATTRLPDYPGAKRVHTRLVPIFEGSLSPRLTFSVDDGLRWTAYQQGRIKLGVIGEYRQHDVKTAATGARHGGDAVEPGGFFEVDTPVATVEARIRRAVTGYRGLSGDLSFDTGGKVRKGTSLAFEARLAWADPRFVRSRYGDEVVTGARTPDYLSGGIQLAGAQAITSKIEIVAAFSEDRLMSSLRGPPIQTRMLRQMTLGLRRRFSG